MQQHFFYKHKHAVFGSRWSGSVTKINLSSRATIRQQIRQRRAWWFTVCVCCIKHVEYILPACRLLQDDDKIHITFVISQGRGGVTVYNLYRCFYECICPLNTLIMYTECLQRRRHVFCLTEMLTCALLILSPSPLQPVPATLSAPSSQVVALSATPAVGSALVSPASEAPAATAACWDTGGFMNTAVAHVTAQGTVTPTLVTAFLGESQDLLPCPYVLVLGWSDVWCRVHSGWLTLSGALPLTGFTSAAQLRCGGPLYSHWPHGTQQQ